MLIIIRKLNLAEMAIRYLNRFAPRHIKSKFHNFLRMNTNEPCPPKSPEPCAPPPPPCPEPPPCPTMPQCPPTICPPVEDPNNPCNYCPPQCIDPNYPDMTKIKKLQCKFQSNEHLPVYLRKGNSDAFLFQLSIVLTLLSTGLAIHGYIQLFSK